MTPVPADFFSWEPFAFEYGVLGSQTIEQRTCQSQADNQDQGYFHTRACADFTRDDSPGSCLRPSWDTMWLAGLLYVGTHGNLDGGQPWVAGIWVDSRQRAEEWLNAGANNAGMLVRPFGPGWTVRVYPEWFRNNWRDALNWNRSIVVMASCFSASGGAASVVQNCGGRVVFGYEGLCPGQPAFSRDMRLLFGRMNGREPENDPGTLRLAGRAFLAGGFDPAFRRFGNDATSLCPAVAHPAVGNVHPLDPPWGNGGGASGTGFVQFDTRVVDREGLDKAVSFQVTSGTLNISNLRWSTEPGQEGRLLFDYQSPDCVPQYEVVVTILEKQITAVARENDPSYWFYLDGGDAYGDFGVAPNGEYQ
jgi:hypothetical protein